MLRTGPARYPSNPPLIVLDEPFPSRYGFAMKSTEQLIADAMALPLSERLARPSALGEH